MVWAIQYHEMAKKDPLKLHRTHQIQVLKAIEKVLQNPLPNYEGGYGKPLGNHATSLLAGYYKIKLRKLGLRVVYGIVRQQETMKVIVISVRDDEMVYRLAKQRIKS